MTTFMGLPFQSYSKILYLAWPVILANLSVPLLGAVDTAVIGHLPDPSYLGSVAIGAMIFSFIYWGFGFLRMGTTGFVAQAAGAEDIPEVKLSVSRAILVALGLSAVILVIQVPLIQFALQMVESSPAVETGAREYFDIRIWGAPAALINYCLIGTFIGLGKTKLALATQIFMNSMNIVLDLVFVIVLDMKVPGVALATAISEYAAVGVGALLLLAHLKTQHGLLPKSQIWNLAALRKMIAVNGDIFVRTILLIFTFAFFTTRAALQGEVVLAATAVLMNFMHFLAFGLDGFAHAAESLVGQSVGGKNKSALDEAVKASSVLAVIVAGLYAVIYWIAGEGIVNLLTGIEEVQAISYEYLGWMVLMPLLAVWSYQLDGIFIGAMRTKEMRNGMVLSFAAYMASILVLPPYFGVHGLFAAIGVFMIARAVTLAMVYGRVRQAAAL
ncbi:MATE family efflux transporter [Sneathiella sp. P13V-1]|uniref:MATE family efflux transporter n=1 Tax=Sneathiella sp. P13V-1 TaxID=2697366 RepID=UPI001D0FFDF2|nr:MATE family efflux transporter [Sneathiella sp. P13V-1]